MKRISLLPFVLALGCASAVAGSKDDVTLELEATGESAADGFGPYQGETDTCYEDGVAGELDARVPYHFWSFTTEGCEDTFVDLASRAGDDTFVLLYARTAGGWSLVDFNDDCGDSLNSCLEVALEPGEYLVGASTYQYMRRRRPSAASYELHISCRDEGACAPEPQACGSRGLEPCPEGEYCVWAAEAMCGRADAPGVCAPRPEICPANVDPVCGCDGRTYSNACMAGVHGISVESDGPCGAAEGEFCGGIAGVLCQEGLLCDQSHHLACGADLDGECRNMEPWACTREFRPECGCDGNTYGNACMRQAAGVARDHEGACGTGGASGEGDLCGGIAGFVCAAGLRCDMSANDFCGADLAGTCVVDEPVFCTEQYEPVCGCDGRTYSNECFRRAAGVPFDHVGEC